MDDRPADNSASGATPVDTSIVSDLQILGGKPCIRGTRISVDLLVELVTHGATVESILDAYAHLRREDVEAALRKAGVNPPQEPPAAKESQREYRGSSYSRR
jgi:uncharacterized protein (DUF433 family)